VKHSYKCLCILGWWLPDYETQYNNQTLWFSWYSFYLLRWSIVTGLSPSLCVVRHRALSAVCHQFHWNIFSSKFTHWIFTKFPRNDPCVVHYQNCLNNSDWLRKMVTRSENVFFKCSFQRYFCLKKQCSELLYLIYNIITRFTTSFSNNAPGANIGPTLRVTILLWFI